MHSTMLLTTLMEMHRIYVRTNSLLMEVPVAPIRPEDHAFVFQASVLVDLRRKLDLNQAELAELLDVPVNTLSRWERGSNIPDANALAALFSIAMERGVKPEFFNQRDGSIVNREVRERLVIQWDHQNMAPNESDAKALVPELWEYSRLLFPRIEDMSGMVYGSRIQWDLQQRFVQWKLEVRSTYYNADEQLVKEGERIFRLAQGKNGVSPTRQSISTPRAHDVLLGRTPQEIDPARAVYVLISNDGDYADFLRRLKEAGAEVFVCGYADCSMRLVRAVGSDHFIPWQRPYIVAECHEVASALGGKTITKGAFGNQCKVALEEDGFEGDDYEELLEDAGFSVNHPFASVLQHMKTFGILLVESPEGDPNRVSFSIPGR